METNKELLKSVPVKIPERLQIEYDIMNFSSKVVERLIVEVELTMHKCMEFYKKVLTTHSRCQTSSARRLQEFPTQEEHLKYLHNRLQEDELHIQLLKGLNEKVVKFLVAQAAVNNCLLEDELRVTPQRVAEIKS